MEKSSLTALARVQLKIAQEASSRRSAQTVYGGHEHVLRQTLIALTAGHQLDEHDNPGEATVHVPAGPGAPARWGHRMGGIPGGFPHRAAGPAQS